jgi:hypothetical protein
VKFINITIFVGISIISFCAGQRFEVHSQNSAWAVFCHCLQSKESTIGLSDNDFIRCNNEAVEFEKSHQ